jgi:type IV secretory pathway TraG/TraD family ATPase VirD4
MGHLLTILLTPFILAWKVLAFAAYLFGFAERGVFRWIRGVKEPDTHGSAKFASYKELKAKGHDKPGGFYVGMLDGKRLYLHREASLLACAPKGQGKSLTICALLIEGAAHGADYVVNDPEGGLWRQTAHTFADKGYRVWVIDVLNPRASSVTYNPLSILRPSMPYDFASDVNNICHLIMPDESTKEPHFQESARLIVKGAIAYAVRENEDATIYDVVDVLTANPTRMRRFLDTALSSPDLMVRQAVAAFTAAGDKEKGSFITTMTRKLEVWGRPRAKDILQTGAEPWTWEWLYNDPQPTIIYIKAGLGTDEGAISRLILGNAINTRRRMHNYGATFQRPLKLVIDEALTIGNCNAMVDANNELRKAGVTTASFYLSLSDLRRTYGAEQADTLVTNSDLLVFGGGKDSKFYEEVSRLIGDKTVESGSTNENSYGESKGRSETARRLIKPEELRALPFNECVATLGPLNAKFEKPFKLGKEGPVFLG